MTEKPTHDRKMLQLFTLSISESKTLISCPLVVHFHIKLRSTIPNVVTKLVDSAWSEQLWTASTKAIMTDVLFLLGDKTFGAHRSILSARSPVFAAMFASGMKEAKTGKVLIEDVDSSLFGIFLKFLYTGIFEPSSRDRELFTVADKYQVETLTELCRSATETVETENILKTFLSC